MTHIGLTAKEMMEKLGITCWISNNDGRVWSRDLVTGSEHPASIYEQKLYRQSLHEYFETGFDVHDYQN